ncbi:hypothetical protein KSP40_PGU005347 [Platanthera guangdongensis]|uniref:Uncharacterized protein n=1 Tax=Platanthera guangdongensis TaxID=2320717 RepID=A0ABR2MA07_9ASPA
MSPYPTPMAYSLMYAPGAVYAHPSMTLGMSYPNTELGEVKSKGSVLKLGEGGKEASISGDDESSHRSNGDSGTDGSSDTKNEITEVQENSKKRSRGDAFQEGQSSHSTSLTQKKRAPKLPVSVPGRTTLPDRELKRERRKQSNSEFPHWNFCTFLFFAFFYIECQIVGMWGSC